MVLLTWGKVNVLIPDFSENDLMISGVVSEKEGLRGGVRKAGEKEGLRGRPGIFRQSKFIGLSLKYLTVI